MHKKSIAKPVGSHIALSRIDTLHCHQKELEHKGGQRYVHDTHVVHTAVGEKARLRTRQHQAVKKPSP